MPRGDHDDAETFKSELLAQLFDAQRTAAFESAFRKLAAEKKGAALRSAFAKLAPSCAGDTARKARGALLASYASLLG